MSYIDVILLLLLAVFTFAAYRNGFLKSIVELLGMIITIPVSWILANKLAEPIYIHFFEPKVLTYVTEKVSEYGGEGSFLEVIRNSVSGISDSLKSLSSSVGLDLNSVLNDFSSGVNSGDFAKRFVDQTIKPFLLVIGSMILFFILLMLTGFIVRIIASFIARIRLPGFLRGINRLLGGAFGLIKGVIIVGFICIFLATIAVVPTTGGNVTGIFKAIDDSVVVSLFNSLNPFI